MKIYQLTSDDQPYPTFYTHKAEAEHCGSGLVNPVIERLEIEANRKGVAKILNTIALRMHFE